MGGRRRDDTYYIVEGDASFVAEVSLLRSVLIICLVTLQAAAGEQAPGGGTAPRRAGAAPAAGLEGRPVLAIQFDTGVSRDEERLQQLLAIQVNQPYRSSKVRESIERLFSTGRFADIQVDAQQKPEGVVLTFITRENYFIGDVRVEGVREPPTTRQLVNVTKLQLGELYTEEKLQHALDGLQKLLVSEGYHRARLEPKFELHKEVQQVDIRLVVAPGERARIREVRLTGEPGFPPQQVLQKSRLKAGKEATAQRLQDAVIHLRKYYQSKKRLGARVQVVERRYLPESNGELVVLRADAGPPVEIRVRGDGVSRRTLKKLIPIYEEGALDEDLVREGARNLRDHYQARGHFEVEVEAGRQENPQTGAVEIEYRVKKGPHHRVTALALEGNRYFDDATLRERMLLVKGGLLSRGRYNRGLLEHDLAVIRDLYQANGFRDVKVISRVEDDYRGRKGHLRVVVAVEEGPQTLVRKLTITGNRQVSREELSEAVAQSDGQPFSEYNTALDRANVLSHYFDHGFQAATFQSGAVPVPGENRVDLEYTIAEGEREFVNEIFASGYQSTRDYIIRQQLQIQEGGPLARNGLLETQRRLYDLGIFSKVDIAVQNPEGREAHRNVLLQVEEARRWTLAVGAGAEIARIGAGDPTSLDQPTGAAGFSPRLSFDVTRLNFRGLNHTLSFKSRVSNLQQRALVNYTAPRFWNAPDWKLFLNAFYNNTRDVRTFTAQRLEGSMALEQKRSKSDTLLYRYSYRRVKVEESTLKITAGLIPLLSRPVRVSMLSASFIRDRRDDPTDSRKGTYLTVDAGSSARQVGSEANFNRLLTQFTTYHRFGKDLVLARTTQFGLQEPFGRLRRVLLPQKDAPPREVFTREIPLPERFFSGGGNSHRGFAVNQAGPRDLQTGFPVGGSGLLMNSLELRFPVRRPDFGGVLFHDMGNVFRRVGDISFRVRQKNLDDFDYMVHAVGAGVRYRTPIGPVRLDFAWSFNPPEFMGLRGNLRDFLRGKVGPPQRRRLDHFQFFFSIGQTY